MFSPPSNWNKQVTLVEHPKYTSYLLIHTALVAKANTVCCIFKYQDTFDQHLILTLMHKSTGRGAPSPNVFVKRDLRLNNLALIWIRQPRSTRTWLAFDFLGGNIKLFYSRKKPRMLDYKHPDEKVCQTNGLTGALGLARHQGESAESAASHQNVIKIYSGTEKQKPPN